MDHGTILGILTTRRAAQCTTKGLYNDDSIEMVLHIGDISYAVGYMSEWENFFGRLSSRLSYAMDDIDWKSEQETRLILHGHG